MEIRILQNEEIKTAAGLSRYVLDYCLRNRMEYPQTVAYVEEYISEANLQMLCMEQKLLLWGVFVNDQMVAVSGLQSDGMITMLYVLPQFQNKGYGSMLLKAMREYARDVLHLSKVLLNATPAWTSFFFGKKGFSYLDAKKDLRAPFVAMHAPSSNIAGFEKRPLSNKIIVAATLGCILLSTLIASFYMISYIF